MNYLQETPAFADCTMTENKQDPADKQKMDDLQSTDLEEKIAYINQVFYDTSACLEFNCSWILRDRKFA